MGNGLASRFSMALSRIIDSQVALKLAETSESSQLSPSKNDKESIDEFNLLLKEINESDNLTVKLASISKIVASFNTTKVSSSLAKKKL